MGNYKLPGIDRSNKTIQPFLILLFMTLPWNWSHIMTPVLAVEYFILVIRIPCLSNAPLSSTSDMKRSSIGNAAYKTVYVLHIAILTQNQQQIT